MNCSSILTVRLKLELSIVNQMSLTLASERQGTWSNNTSSIQVVIEDILLNIPHDSRVMPHFEDELTAFLKTPILTVRPEISQLYIFLYPFFPALASAASRFSKIVLGATKCNITFHSISPLTSGHWKFRLDVYQSSDVPAWLGPNTAA